MFTKLNRSLAVIFLLLGAATLTHIHATEKSVHQGLLNDYKPQQITANT